MAPLRQTYTHFKPALAHVPLGRLHRVPVPSARVLWTERLFYLIYWMFEPFCFTEEGEKSLFDVEKQPNT